MEYYLLLLHEYHIRRVSYEGLSKMMMMMMMIDDDDGDDDDD